MRRQGQFPRSGTDRTAVVPVWLNRAEHVQAHEASHAAALQWNQLVQWLRSYWDENESDPGFVALRAYGDSLKVAPLHSQSIQGIAEDMHEAVKTYRKNKAAGLRVRAPWREKKYRPVSFSRNYGWRVTPEGKLALSYGKGRERIVLDLPEFTDPLTGLMVPSSEWGEIRLCWDRQARAWALHVNYKTHAFTALPRGDRLDPGTVVVSVDPGVINPVTVAVPDGAGGFDVTVVNGRSIRSIKRLRNKKVRELQKLKSRCKNGSRRHKRLVHAERRVKARAERQVSNANHHVSRITADLVRDAAIDRSTGEIRKVAVVMGDVRGIEQKTRQKRRANRSLRQQLSQWSRGATDRQLEYKTGLALDYIPEQHTTKTCPACGNQRRSSPKGRAYTCTNLSCLAVFHRDAVGAVNIHSRATHADGTIRPGTRPEHIRVTYRRALPTPPRAKDLHAVEALEQGPSQPDRPAGVADHTSTPQAA